MPQRQSKPLRDLIDACATHSFLCTADARISVCELARGSLLGGSLPLLAERSVLVATRDQLTGALALIELDGVARRLIICPPDLADKHVPEVIAIARADAVIRDPADARHYEVALQIPCRRDIATEHASVPREHETEWIMLTSGTSGTPKMVVHTLEKLAGAISREPAQPGSTVWATFYDMRRYGGLQIFLRAIIGATSFVFSSAEESMTDHLQRLGREGVTHLTGTPSHWRWAILNPAARAISPHYVRLSAEIADQAILDTLHEFYPSAKVAHAYASTEAGVGFDVTDGLAGFPASIVEAGTRRVHMKVIDGSLRIRSDGTASRYLGKGGPLLDCAGFVDTGDLVELRGGRYYFIGRQGGIINVGGLKVHPEEIEAVINSHPDVRMSLVRTRKNPITGALVVADVVLTDPAPGEGAELEEEILERCRDVLPRHKVPAAIRFVPALRVAGTGKLVRERA